MRLRDLSGEFDVAIIGGGIIGAGIARDAALRGLRVALVEKADYGGGTTAGSTRLIHGGLRYLEMLDFRLVRMDLRERETLLRIASHLVKPLEFLLPFYSSSLFYRTKMRAGMLLYDALSYDKSLPRHRIHSAADVRKCEPQIRESGLQGGASYYDAQVASPERLAIENIIAARERGAVTLNYAEATGAVTSASEVRGIRVHDALDGSEAELRARLVVNASGPWFDRVAARLAPHPRPQIRTTKGAHLACEAVINRAVAVPSPIDGRLFFVIPWLGYSWVSTTDTDFNGDPAEACATEEDVDYLKRSAAHYFPALADAPVYWTNAGVRALVMQPGSESSVSRMHRIDEGVPGLVSVLGGKITGYRAIAQEVTDRICRRLGVRQRSRTAEIPLPGARSRAAGAPEHLAYYGGRAAEVLRLAEAEPALRQPLAAGHPDIAAQVVFAARFEQCAGVSDFLLRRCLLGFSHDQGVGAAPEVARWLARELGWSAAHQQKEVEAYRQRCQQHEGVPV